MVSASAGSRQAAHAGHDRRWRAARALPSLALIAVLVGALLIRLDFARNSVVFKDDHGTAALVSWHILRGQELPLYSYGSFKVGAIGNYAGALMFAVFGVSVESLCLSMTAFTLLWVFASYLLFARLICKWAGVIAAALVAFAPFTVMWYSVVPMVFYPPTFAFGTLVLYLGVRLNDRDLTGRAEWGCLVGMAAVAGLAIWTNALSAMYLLVGVGLLAAHVIRSRLRPALLVKLAVAFVVLLVTVSPTLVTVWQHGYGAVYGYRSHESSVVRSNLALVGDYYITDMLLKGVGEQGIVRWVLKLAYAVPAAAFLVGFFVGIVMAVARRDRRLLRATLVPVLFVLSAALMFLPSPMAATKAPRYFVPFYLAVSAIFAFPLVFRRTWITAATAVLALVVMGANTGVSVGTGHGKDAGRGKRRMAEMRALVEDVEAAGLRHVMIDSLEGQPLTFVARERVIFARTLRERYYPYAVGAAADDRTGFAKGQRFASTLQSVGIKGFKTLTGAGEVVFYDLVLPTEGLRVVEVQAISAAGAPPAVGNAADLVDENDETVVGAPFDAESALVVDFGQEVSLCGARFVAAEEWNYPGGYTLSGSTDGSTWFEVQSVEVREAAACIYGNRFYCRGQDTVMECRFPAKPVRHLKIHELRPALPRLEEWRVQEAYFYTAADGGLPDEREAAQITRTLAEDGVAFALCDEWLSRKIETQPQPRPEVLPHYEWQQWDTHVSRTLPVWKHVAVVVEAGHADQCRALIEAATFDEATVRAIEFPHYTALVIEAAPACWRDFPGLKWNGFTLVGTARIATAAWYHERGKHLERSGRADEAMAYFVRAFATFSGIPGNLEQLAPHDEEAAARLKVLTPEFASRCELCRGISLVGYTLVPSTLVAGERATLRLVWELEGKMPHNYLPVFVHFLDEARGGGTIRFQADHNVAFPVVRGAEIPRCLVLDEHEFSVPAECPPGRLAIQLGGLVWGNQSKRLRPRTNLPTRDRAVEVGHVEVTRAASD